jgi:hypothetical protein
MALAWRLAGGWRNVVGQLTPADITSILHVLTIAVWMEAAIRLLPLPTATRLAGVSLGTVETTPFLAPPTLTAAERRAVRWSGSVMRRWPLGTGICLRKSLVIGHFVRRLEPTLRIGIARDGNTIGAHAWLEVPGAVNIGGRGHVAFELMPSRANADAHNALARSSRNPSASCRLRP